MQHKYASLVAVLALMAGCTALEMPAPEVSSSSAVFTAQLPQLESASATKMHLNANFTLGWDYLDDSISVFSPKVHAMYRIQQPFSGSGASYVKEGEAENTGVDLKVHYAVYPYLSSNSIDADGTLHLTIPEKMSSYDIPMVARTRNLEDHLLLFKAVCGIIRVPVSGQGNILKTSIRGNNNESIAGEVAVKISKDGDMDIRVLGEGKTVTRGGAYLYPADENTPYYIYFFLPPVEFTKGFTITLTDVTGKEFVFSTDKARTVQRNVYNTLDAIEVDCAAVAPYTSASDAKADLDKIYELLAYPMYHTSRHSEFGILSSLHAMDAMGADLTINSSGYNWFSNYCEYNFPANYAEVQIRYLVPMEIIRRVNLLRAGITEGSSAYEQIVGQAQILEAYAYLQMAQLFGKNPMDASWESCVPIITPETPYLYLPAESMIGLTRSSVAEVYAHLTALLEDAYAKLSSFRRSSHAQADAHVAAAILARACMDQGQYNKALEWAETAASGFTPASREEVSVPSFMDISEHNWIWGADITSELIGGQTIITNSSWLRSFSGNSYAVDCNVTARINTLLYYKIPSSDVRKGWWLNEYGQSPLIKGIEWDGTASLECFSNVKFGCNPAGNTDNIEDMPLVRVEEMLLVQAEAQARLGNDAEARRMLNAFVQGYRDPSYSCTLSGSALLDEIWFQRRVELWGEGFAIGDIKRLGKPLVRFHGDEESNVSEVYRFNIPAGDALFQLPIPQSVLSHNPGMSQNVQGTKPGVLDNESLRDGVTD